LRRIPPWPLSPLHRGVLSITSKPSVDQCRHNVRSMAPWKKQRDDAPGDPRRRGPARRHTSRGRPKPYIRRGVARLAAHHGQSG